MLDVHMMGISWLLVAASLSRALGYTVARAPSPLTSRAAPSLWDRSSVARAASPLSSSDGTPDGFTIVTRRASIEASAALAAAALVGWPSLATARPMTMIDKTIESKLAKVPAFVLTTADGTTPYFTQYDQSGGGSRAYFYLEVVWRAAVVTRFRARLDASLESVCRRFAVSGIPSAAFDALDSHSDGLLSRRAMVRSVV